MASQRVSSTSWNRLWSNFAAVVNPIAFRALFAIVAFYDLEVEQLDVNTAFLHGIIDQLLYVDVPRENEQQWKDQVCRLKNVLNGLKQSDQRPVTGFQDLTTIGELGE